MHQTITEGKTIQQSGGKIIGTEQGFSLVEIMTVLVIISILALFAAPEVTNWRPRMRLKSAADALSENMQRAKMHAIKNNVSVIFTFTKGSGNPCTGGSYSFVDSAGNPVASEIFNDSTTPESLERTADLCLSATTFVAADGFSSRGLPLLIPGGGAITLSNAKLTAATDPIYVITQTVAGGIQLQKGHN